jgi:hypothetical protein
MQQDRRTLQRTKTSKLAKIIFGALDHTLINCIVLDLSGDGACLYVDNCDPIPNDIELTFDAARTLRACRVAWQLNGRLGVEFLRQRIIDRNAG